MDNYNDEYFNRCHKLSTLIQKAYIDKGLLQAIEIYNKESSQNALCIVKQSFYAVGYICELIKSDLALTIWKIYLDNDHKANTLQLLNSFMEKMGKGKKISIKISKKYDSVCSNLKTLRNQSLAHEGIKKEQTHINVTILNDMLDEITNMYNGLCDNSIDCRVKPVDLPKVSCMSLNYMIGFLRMINGASADSDKSSQEVL